MKTDLSSYKNDWYKAEIKASRFKQIAWYLTNILFFKNSLNISSGLKVSLLRMFGAKVGKGVVIKPSVNIKYPWKLTIGDHAWIGENVWIDNLADVLIGSNACLSQGAMLLTGNHDFTKSTFDLMVKGIVLEEGAWIGAQAMVCPGITCRSHAVLAACSVATKDLEEYKIYQGNPAVEVRERKIT
ncbi:MAG: putative colanic acid biosynthesis acetyltransferase [Chitinophagaceae bacterium]